MTYDPAFIEHGVVPEPHHLHRRRQGHPGVPRLPDRAARGEVRLPRDGVPPDLRRAPDPAQHDAWKHDITHHTMPHENIKKFMDGFRYDAHPMGILLSTVAALSTFYPDAKDIFDQRSRRIQTIRLIAKMPTIAAFAYRHVTGLPFVYPDNDLELHRQLPEHDVQDDGAEVQAEPRARARARRALHPARRSRAELLHQRDARRSAARTSIPYSALAGAAAALYGPLHGGANEAVLRMLQRDRLVDNVPEFIKQVKAGEAAPDGLRPPRLQELRPAREDHQAASPTRCSR